MGNQPSRDGRHEDYYGHHKRNARTWSQSSSFDHTNQHHYSKASPPPSKGFPGSAFVEGMLCGAVDTSSSSATLMERADQLCISSPKEEDDSEANSEKPNPTSALFARALVSEVTENRTTQTELTEREKKLLRAQQQAAKTKSQKAVGAPGGIGQPSVLHTIAHAFQTSTTASDDGSTNLSNQRSSHAQLKQNANQTSSVEPPNELQENRAQTQQSVDYASTSIGGNQDPGPPPSKHRVTIGLSLSRRHSTVGHPDTVTRQTAFDFNELQDREYKYVSNTDSCGWRAGGGEGPGNNAGNHACSSSSNNPVKVASPDTVHIAILHIDAASPEAVDTIIHALARGEVFIPHMSVLPEALSVNGISPPDLVVRFGCERNDDVPPDEWPNWCLEFMHNQLFEYFSHMGARWMKRPFQIELAKKVRWKTVKHMNRYFSHAERVLDAWREKGPQYLDPQLSYIEGGATPEEVARPHGVYLMRNGVPTNYFAPNFDPPYTSKMTRSLLCNVLDKSWDKKRREWTSEPVPKLLSPVTLVASMCGCSDPSQGGFLAHEVTAGRSTMNTSIEHAVTTSMDESPRRAARSSSRSRSYPMDNKQKQAQEKQNNSAASRPGRTRHATEIPIGQSSSNPGKPKGMPLPDQQSSIHSTASSPPLDSATEHMSEVAASASTVQHVNSTSVKLVQREMDRKTLNQQHRRIHDTVEEEVTTPSSIASSSVKSDFGKRKKRNKQERDADRIAIDPSLRDPRKKQLAQMHLLTSQHSVLSNEEKKSERSHLIYNDGGSSTATLASAGAAAYSPDVHYRDSDTVSLEYSLDSSMLGENSTLLGGQYLARTASGGGGGGDGASSVKSSGSGGGKQSSLASLPRLLNDDDSSGASTANNSLILPPSDQELYAVGWAKALDPKSGSYYYFTLDRTKIVWDNPLEPTSRDGGGSVLTEATGKSGVTTASAKRKKQQRMAI